MLVPGYLAVSPHPALLYSVCANGVIVTIWDRVMRIGGMAHCMYPSVGREEKSATYYADFAVPQVIRKMMEFKGRFMVAQLLGGSHMHGERMCRRTLKLVATIRKILKQNDIRIVSEDLGGRLGRKIVFDTYSGDVMVLKTKNIRKTDWWID
jgi:chemotaxis protein CheD